jgi:plasmid stability protein
MATATHNRPQGGKLRIGDDWNAITIIALSQQSPLKAIAEFVENSLDARATRIVITRGREQGQHYLRITDDGDGVPCREDGLPDFPYVATHICDSLKRQLRAEDRAGVQGEFGIGLLSFWTLAEQLTLASPGRDGHLYEMRMRKGDPSYTVNARRRLFAERGTELVVKPLLPGIRSLSGEKIQWYLAAELRDRLRRTGARLEVIDRIARARHDVVPREFTGELLHQLPAVTTPHGDVYLELYLSDANPENRVGLCRHGTRVIEEITALDAFQRPPWNTGHLQGIVDAPFLNLTPGTRSGIVHDERLTALCEALAPVETALAQAIEEHRRAADEQASRQILKTIQRAFHEALLALPAEEYDWFEIPDGPNGGHRAARPLGLAEPVVREQKQFFEFPGPLYSVTVSPSSCVVPVGTTKNFRAVPRDRERRLVESGLSFRWDIVEGGGALANAESEIAIFAAPAEPGLTRLRVRVTQAEVSVEAEARVTTTDELPVEEPRKSEAGARQGLPAYTFERAPGGLWRSRFDPERNLIVINNAHRDFVFAARQRMVKLRYICRLYVKELVQKNFPGLAADQLLERMVELSLYTEEHLK